MSTQRSSPAFVPAVIERGFSRRVKFGVAVEQAVFSGLLLLIALAATPFGTLDSWWDGVFETGICILTLGWLVTVAIGRQWRMPTLLLPIFAVIVLAFLQILPLRQGGADFMVQARQTISTDPDETLSFITRMLTLAVTLAILLAYTASRKRLLALTHLVIVVGAASAVFAISRMVLLDLRFSSEWFSKLQSESFGQFPNRNHFALLMEMSWGPALGLALLGVPVTRRSLYVAAAVLIWIALVLSNSRGAIISMFGQLGFLSWTFVGGVFDPAYATKRALVTNWWQKSVYRRCILIPFFLGVALIGVLQVGGERVRHRLETVPAEFVSRGDGAGGSPRRLEIWMATWRLIKDYPLLGSGFGAYQSAIPAYLEVSPGWKPQQAHDEYLELLSSGGVVGGALGVWFVFILLRQAHKRLNDRAPLRRAVCLGALVSLVGVAIHSLVDFGLHVTANALILCALIALATAQVRPALSVANELDC